MDFVNMNWKCAGFFLITSGFLINLRIESTAQFTVCAPATAIKMLSGKYRTLAWGCFVFQKEKDGKIRNPRNHSEFDLIDKTSFWLFCPE